MATKITNWTEIEESKTKVVFVCRVCGTELVKNNVIPPWETMGVSCPKCEPEKVKKVKKIKEPSS